MRGVLLVTALIVTVAGRAFAQPPCQLDEAARAYTAGNFDQALQSIDACLADRPTSDQRIQAFALRAKLYLAIDDIDAAEQSVAALLGAMPDFAPSLDDPPRFVRMVGQSKREIARNTTSSVSKMNEGLLEAPATVAVVTADQIRRRGYLDLEAVLHDLPGFDISRSNGTSYANVYQRGYRSDSTNRTLVLVDGVEQNDLYSNTAHISRQYPLSNIDRVEVVYGPASTMYGANAFLGVINVITKDPEDIIAEGKKIGIEAQAGGGAWKTRFLDATIAGRFRNATFSLTGRTYKSNEWDLSRYDGWNYNPAVYGSQPSRDQYDRFLFGSGFGEILKNILGAERFRDPFNPITLDQKAFESSVNGRPVGYSDLTDDWMVSAKLKIKNFTAGVHTWREREGSTGEGTDMEAPGAHNGNIWIPHETSFFARYAEPLSGNLSISYLGQAKVHGLGRGSAVFSMNGYLNGPLDLANLYPFFFKDGEAARAPDGDPAFWSQTLVAQSSNQIRNELNLIYRRANRLSVVGGIDVRNGSIQADYVEGSNCAPYQSIFSRFTNAELREGVDRNADDPAVEGRIVQLLVFAQPRAGVWVQCSPTGTPAVIPNRGGEHFAVRDIGAFAQGSYTASRTVKLIAGWRVDNNHISQGSGFGTVFTPRLGIVHSWRGFVTKGIYAEAFKDPSNFEKFATLPGILDRPDRPLQPERARNLEVSAGRRWDRFTTDVSVYRTTYSDLVTLAPHTLAFDSQVQAFLKRLERRLLAEPGVELSDALRSALAPEPIGVIRKIFDDPIFIERFENAGALRVWGVQANASLQYRNLDLFANYTYTHPIFTEATNELTLPSRSASQRVGDIASHHLNAGVQRRWGKLDTSVRLNYVGTRPTVLSNPLSTIPPYAIASAAVGYLDLLPGLSAQLIVNNIFDTQYADPGVRTADGVRFATSIPQPGRSIFLKVLTRAF